MQTATTSRLAVLLFTDLVGSTELKKRVGTGQYARLLSRHDEIFKRLIATMPDAEILTDTGDGYFAAFTTIANAVHLALRFQHAVGTEPWGADPLRTRIGIHVGEVAEVHSDEAGRPKVVGVAADLASRITALAQAGQILLTRVAFDEARQFISEHPDEATGATALRWVAHGAYLFKGHDEPVEVFEVGAEGTAPFTAPPDTPTSRRSVAAGHEETLGWRPATGLFVPQRHGWKVDRKLGEGTFGEVWLATHVTTKQHRVFKFCFDAERLRSFKRELTLFRLLRDALGDRHDIAHLYDVRLDQPPFFLEGEHAPRGNLADWAQSEGGLATVPLETRLEIVAKVGDAVAAAHSVGVLHKDIKPSNILIYVESDGTFQPRLSDFGIGILIDHSQLAARHITDAGFTSLGQNESSRTGTRMYAPPELLAGKPFTTQGDIYALGVLLYQMAIGDLNRPVALGWERDIPDELLREDIAAALEGEPKRRLNSAADLAVRLRTLPQRRQERDHIRDLREAAERRHRRNRALGAAAVIFALLGALAAGGFVLERRSRMRAEASERKAQLAYASAAIEQGTALHLAGRGQQSRAAFVRARDELSRLGESTLATEVGLYRSYRDFDAPINTISGHQDGVMAVAWVDNERICSAAEDGTARLWDARTGEQIRVFSGHKGVVGGLAISPDHKQLLTGGEDKTVRLWEIDSGMEIRSFTEPTGSVRGVAFSHDGRRALWAAYALPGAVRMADLESGNIVRTFGAPVEQRYYGIACSPDGKQVAATTYDNNVCVWDASSGEMLKMLRGHTGYVIGVAYSPDSRRLLSSSFDETARLWDVQTWEEAARFEGHTAGVRGVAFVDAGHVITASMDTSAKLWDVQTRKAVRTFAGHTDGLRGIAVSPDGRRAATGGIDRTVRLWDLRTGVEVPMAAEKETVTSLAASPDGTMLISGDKGGAVTVRDAATLRVMQRFEGLSKGIERAAILPDGRRVIAVDCCGAGRIWDLLSARELRSYEARGTGGTKFIRADDWLSTAFSADGRVALTSKADRTMDLWSIDTGSTIRSIPTTQSAVRALAVSPDGKRALSGDEAGRIDYWDLDNGTKIFSTPVSPKPGMIDCIAISADGKTALTAGHELNVRKWDLESGKCVGEFNGHTLVVKAVAFAPDGRTIFSSGGDQTVRMWDAYVGGELNLAGQLPDYSFALAVLPSGAMAVSSGGQIVLWDAARPLRYLEFDAHAAAPRPSASGLLYLGRWYAFRGANDWAIEILEKARSAGADVPALLLARSYWKLDRYDEAALEFRRAITRDEAPADYLNLCLSAVSGSSSTRPTTSAHRN